MTNETNAISTQGNAIKLKLFGQADCRPCAVLKAVINGERSDIEAMGVAIEHVDLTPGIRDDRADIIAKYGIMSTPVTVIEKGSEVVTRFNGMFNMKELYETLEYAKEAK